MSFENFNSIIQIVIEIITLVLGGFLVPYIKSRIGAEKYAKILQAVEEGVSAAEQIYKHLEKSDEKNELRYQYALNYLKSKGINLTEEQMKTLIEDAVNKLNKSV
jgi:hypothetical protein